MVSAYSVSWCPRCESNENETFRNVEKIRHQWTNRWNLYFFRKRSTTNSSSVDFDFHSVIPFSYENNISNVSKWSEKLSWNLESYLAKFEITFFEQKFYFFVLRRPKVSLVKRRKQLNLFHHSYFKHCHCMKCKLLNSLWYAKDH